MTALQRLPAHDDEGNVRVVVEAPRGSTVKLKYEPKLSDRTREELEQFFVTVVEMTDKKVHVAGWRGPKHARKLLEEAAERYAATASSSGSAAGARRR